MFLSKKKDVRGRHDNFHHKLDEFGATSVGENAEPKAEKLESNPWLCCCASLLKSAMETFHNLVKVMESVYNEKVRQTTSELAEIWSWLGDNAPETGQMG